MEDLKQLYHNGASPVFLHLFLWSTESKLWPACHSVVVTVNRCPLSMHSVYLSNPRYYLQGSHSSLHPLPALATHQPSEKKEKYIYISKDWETYTESPSRLNCCSNLSMSLIDTDDSNNYINKSHPHYCYINNDNNEDALLLLIMIIQLY